jgi:hypothetical protein
MNIKGEVMVLVHLIGGHLDGLTVIRRGINS